MVRELLHQITLHPAWVSAREFVELPPWPGYKLSAKRLLNLYRARYAHRRGLTRLRSYPAKLTVEAANVCNLRCPACFTGIGESGRVRSVMSLALYRKLLSELGDYLFEVEFYNWGEPLLSKYIYTMIEETAQRGISTTISTNFSIPFDAEKAERLVSSGLAVLGVSIDGARQDSYEKYRVRGDLKLVLRNCRLVAAAKQRLASKTPRLVWEFHVFEHNVEDVDLARGMAKELGMDISVDKGWVIGSEWNPDGEWQFFDKARPVRCPFLWGFAVVNNDGGVAPCCGTFYSEDDMGSIAVRPPDLEASTFWEVWNGPRFQAARALFHSRNASGEAKKLACFDCPNTIIYENWKRHRGAGGTLDSFDVGYTMNDVVNYFWNRRPQRGEDAPPHRDAATPPTRALAGR